MFKGRRGRCYLFDGASRELDESGRFRFPLKEGGGED